MDSLTLADAFWSALVLAGGAALVLDGVARRRPARRTARRGAVAAPVAPGVVEPHADRADEERRTPASV